MIEQEPFCGVRTHFYHNASSYDMFRDRRVVEQCSIGQTNGFQLCGFPKVARANATAFVLFAHGGCVEKFSRFSLKATGENAFAFSSSRGKFLFLFDK